jgi:hypothetical protein
MIKFIIEWGGNISSIRKVYIVSSQHSIFNVNFFILSRTLLLAVVWFYDLLLLDMYMYFLKMRNVLPVHDVLK